MNTMNTMNTLPLPPNWTEHRAPTTGQLYYYNTLTRESTYIRPLPLPINPNAPKKKKEKFVEKVLVPGTEWMRVKTEKGDVFWNHRVEKRSVWVVPEEIKEIVEEWEGGAKEDKVMEGDGKEGKGEKDEEGEKKRKAEELKEEDGEKKKKRKRGGKKAREARAAKEKEKIANDENDIEVDALNDGEDVEMGEEEREQRKMLEELKNDEDVSSNPNPANPYSTLTPPEQRALFLSLLRSKSSSSSSGIDPYAPWDTILPLIIDDPRYLALPNINLRKEVFDEYCKIRIREMREEKTRLASASSSGIPTTLPTSTTTKTEDDSSTLTSYKSFLRAVVTSTRTTFTEFKRIYRKDRRFYSFGRDERERERVFREWLRELGESEYEILYAPTYYQLCAEK